MRVLCNRDVSNEDNQCRFKVGDVVKVTDGAPRQIGRVGKVMKIIARPHPYKAFDRYFVSLQFIDGKPPVYPIFEAEEVTLYFGCLPK